MKVLLPSGQVLIRNPPRRRRPQTLRSFVPHYSQMAVADDPISGAHGISWLVTLKNGSLYEYFYTFDPATVQVFAYQQLTITDLGFVFTNQLGGEFFNYLLRSTCFAKY
jgi:hypothetical protein